MSCDPADRTGAIVDIDLGAVIDNWRLVRRIAAPAECAAVVKANAYGLGAGPVAQALASVGCRTFFVATLDEGIALRHALGTAPEIAVFNGPFPGTAAEFVERRLIPVLNTPDQIKEWASGLPPPPQAGEGGVGMPAAVIPDAADPHPSLPRLRGRVSVAGSGAESPPAILHVDTGMARLGLTARDFASLLENPPAIAWRAVMSHLACADTPDHAMNEAQRRRFADAAAHLPGVPASLAASSGAFLGASYHFDLVRPGAALFGVNPRAGGRNPLRPVVRLLGKILQVRQIDRGQSVGYGAAHVMRTPGSVATVAIGYADGWLRSLSHRGCGYLAGKRVPLIGRVSMDLVTFDVSAVDPAVAHPGAMIELLGDHYGVDDAASDAGTIGYEVLTSLGSRYHRVYRDPAPADLRAHPPG